MNELKPFIGKSLEEFTQEAEKLGLEVRVEMKDGKPQMGLMNMRKNRINVSITENNVTEILGIG